MNYASGPGLQIIYTSDWDDKQPLSSTKPQVISLPFRLANATGCSVQVFSDGGAAYTYKFQVSNLPRNVIQYGATVNGATQRDDSAASTHWDTTPNGNGTVGAGASVTTLLFTGSVFREGRVIFNWTSGSGKLFAILATAE